MAWPYPGDKPLSELMMVSLLTHISVTRPLWVNVLKHWGLDKMASIASHLQLYFLMRKLCSARSNCQINNSVSIMTLCWRSHCLKQWGLHSLMHIQVTRVSSLYKDCLSQVWGLLPMLKIRWLKDSVIFNMRIPILVRHLYIETTPRPQWAPLMYICWCRKNKFSHTFLQQNLYSSDLFFSHIYKYDLQNKHPGTTMFCNRQ